MFIILLTMDNTGKKKPSESLVNMEELVLPNDANGLDNLFGGRLLQWIDIAAAMSAMKHSRKDVVTAGIDRVDFREPVRVGDMVKLTSKVTWTGRTSMEVKITVKRENPGTGEIVQTNEAFMTMVALDKSGKPSPVPQLEPETGEEKKDFREAADRRSNRLAEKPCPEKN